MLLVNSRAIRAVGYDGQTLAVQFTTSDIVYLHPGVPYAVYVALMQAESKGHYYGKYIRGRYR